MRGQGRHADGRDIPARAIAKLLSNILIYEPIANWEDARIRYAGFSLAKLFGGDITGLPYSKIMADDRGGTLKRLFFEARSIVADNLCLTWDHKALSDGVTIAHQELVTFPISSPDGANRWILSAAFDVH
ncbi:MAG TPA: PAS domain-containing protein [Rhizomicrobium sp.]